MTSRHGFVPLFAWGAVVLVIACLQVLFVHRRIPTVEPGDVRGVELRVTTRWRYGYVPGMHGATLIRVPNQGTPLRAPDGVDPEITEWMGRALGRTPWLALAEGLLYLACLIAGRRALGVVRRSVLERGIRPALWRAGALALALAAALLFPYLAFGYGGGAYTSLVGPGAVGFHGTFPSIGFSTGDTVSYRTAVEVVLLPVGFLSRMLSFGGEALSYTMAGAVIEEMTGLRIDKIVWEISFWLSLIVVYSGAGVLIAGIVARTRRREPERS